MDTQAQRFRAYVIGDAAATLASDLSVKQYEDTARLMQQLLDGRPATPQALQAPARACVPR